MKHSYSNPCLVHTKSRKWIYKMIRDRLCGMEQKRTYITRDLPADKQASLYVHWPYCSRECSYCSFNRFLSYDIDEKRFTRCLVKEIKTSLHQSGIQRINSIYFGGGTPSLADPSSILNVIEVVKDCVALHPEAEISLEVNPTPPETKKLSNFKVAGVNRVSIGVQSLNNDRLALLGRNHSNEHAVRCLLQAQQLFPGEVSIDMVFGIPHQTPTEWEEELCQVLKFCDSHVSLYELTPVKGTQMYKWIKAGLITVPDEELVADMYDAAYKMLTENGFQRYEVSNFAREGAECQHNISYWTGSQYIGVGPGAHSRFIPCGLNRSVREARVQESNPSTWMSEIEKNGHATCEQVPLSAYTQLEELLILGLRTKEGVSEELWNSLHLRNLMSTFHGSEDVQNLIEKDLLILDHRGIRATSNGILVLDSILLQLLYELKKQFKNDVHMK